jgi:Zn-dependent membrane protease YugP
MPIFFDPNYLLIVGPTMLLAMWATWRVRSTFTRYANVGVRSGMTGAEAAAAVARAAGLDVGVARRGGIGAEGQDAAKGVVNIQRFEGFLTDHYNPSTKTLNLSPDVYDGRSVSSIAVAAHECGHAMQDADGYVWLTFRSHMVPVTKIGSSLWIWVFFAGMIFKNPHLTDFGIILFGAVVLFQLVTLPVEFDASRRAKAVLASSGIVSTQEEAQGVSRVLGAAAMTYVAGALTAVATLLYLLLSSRRRN